MKNVFTVETRDEIINRINSLTVETQRVWGTMDVAQMLAHCNVAYELVFTDKHPKPGAFKAFILKLLVKPIVVNEKIYPKNTRTAPEFLIANEKDFEAEKKRLIDYITQVQELGESHFDGKASHSFGPLTKTEWNNMFYKHLDHHLRQFGA